MNHRSHAFLALLTAAANEAIGTGRCDLLAPNRAPLQARTSVLFDATIGAIPLRVCMSDWRSDEARLAVAAWPTPDVDQRLAAFGANDLAGDVTVIGDLTRDGIGRLRLSNPFEPTIFMRRSRLAAMKALPAPDDAADPLHLYPRYLSYAAAA